MYVKWIPYIYVYVYVYIMVRKVIRSFHFKRQLPGAKMKLLQPVAALCVCVCISHGHKNHVRLCFFNVCRLIRIQS